jgi:hypothetical protein
VLKFILELGKTLSNGLPFLGLLLFRRVEYRNGTVDIIYRPGLEEDQCRRGGVDGED